MLKMKQEIEQKFLDEWTETPIQFDIVDYSTATDSAWVSLMFDPLSREEIGFGGSCSRKMDTAFIKVLCFETSPTKVLMLEDKVKEFMECYTFSTVGAYTRVGEPNGEGINNLENGVWFSTLQFNAVSHG